MINHPGEPVPAEMPKDLERVYAALEVPLDLAPEALLERILRSRIEGQRMLLPVEELHRSGFRRRLLPIAIAAALGLVALGTWSTVSNNRQRQVRLVDDDSWDLGLVSTAMAQSVAQSTAKPKYPPIRFDASRLHRVTLTYSRRSIRNSEPAMERWTGTYALEPIGDGRQGWYMITRSKFVSPTNPERPYWRSQVDTLRLIPPTLEPAELIRWLSYSDGRWRRNSYQIGDTLVKLHSTRHGALRSADLRRPEIYDSAFPIPKDAFPRVVQRLQWIADLMAAPLATGWKGSVTQLGVENPGPAFPIDFAVTGEEQLATSSGPQDCWRIRVLYGGSLELTLLVRKRDGVLVRERMTGKDGRDTWTNEMVLIAEQ